MYIHFISLSAEPFLETTLLRGAQIDAIVDLILSSGKSSSRGRYLMSGEETCDLIDAICAAKGTSRADDISSAELGKLGCYFAPVILDILPG